jgi:hypothetical protein
VQYHRFKRAKIGGANRPLALSNGPLNKRLRILRKLAINRV